jgi:hypothetical protein
MLTTQAAQLIAADRMAEAQRHAAAARLAAIARCCRPSTWARTGRRAAAGVTRLLAAVRGDRPIAAPCCA